MMLENNVTRSSHSLTISAKNQCIVVFKWMFDADICFPRVAHSAKLESAII